MLMFGGPNRPFVIRRGSAPLCVRTWTGQSAPRNGAILLPDPLIHEWWNFQQQCVSAARGSRVSRFPLKWKPGLCGESASKAKAFITGGVVSWRSIAAVVIFQETYRAA